jgi:hypothetical protein
MIRARLTKTSNQAIRKAPFSVLAVMVFCLAHPASTGYAKDKKKQSPPFGTIRIQTTPAVPLDIDGKPQGPTTTIIASSNSHPVCTRL